MKAHADKTQENRRQPVSNDLSKTRHGNKSTFTFVDNRPETVAQRKLQEMANNSPQAKQTAQLQVMTNNYSVQQQQPIQKKENNTGLPDNLKTGMENLSGMSLDDVKVHRNSDKPAQLQVHAYAQGTDIHLGPGQERHLPHEAWHVVQQKQGRVKPTMQMQGKVNVNDDKGLENEADAMGAKAMSNILQTKSTGNTLTANSSKPQEVVQRAIGAEIETNLQVQDTTQGNRPVPGKHEELVGTITTPYGIQKVVIDTGTILEITTDPKDRLTVRESSELPDLLGYLANIMKGGNNPRFGIHLVGNFQNGVVGFKSGTNALMGDIQVNVSPLDPASVLKYYDTVSKRRNVNEARADDTLERLINKKIWEEQQLDIVRKAVQKATNLAMQMQATRLRLSGAPGAAEVRGIEAIIIRSILDLVMNLNLREGDSATDKNKLDVLPKFDIQQKLKDFSNKARVYRVPIGKTGNEKAILFSSLHEAIEGSYSVFSKLKKKGALLNIINDTYDIVIKGRKTIRNRAGESMGDEEMDPLINKSTSTNMIPSEQAEHGVYEDRNPFRASLEAGSVAASGWEAEMLIYELNLWKEGVRYLKP